MREFLPLKMYGSLSIKLKVPHSTVSSPSCPLGNNLRSLPGTSSAPPGRESCCYVPRPGDRER